MVGLPDSISGWGNVFFPVPAWAQKPYFDGTLMSLKTILIQTLQFSDRQPCCLNSGVFSRTQHKSTISGLSRYGIESYTSNFLFPKEQPSFSLLVPLFYLSHFFYHKGYRNPTSVFVLHGSSYVFFHLGSVLHPAEAGTRTTQCFVHSGPGGLPSC